MKTITSLLTIAEAATSQIEEGYDKDLSQEDAVELRKKAAVAMDLLDNVESYLKAETSEVSKALPTDEQISHLFGT